MSRDFEDGPPLSRKARTMERLDQETLRERMRTTIGDVHVTPAELSALISSHESLAAELVTERAMHSAALERADALGEKLQECEAAGAAMREAIARVPWEVRNVAGKREWHTPWATVFENGVWHTWNHDGSGGQNDRSSNFAQAKEDATGAAIAQGFVKIESLIPKSALSLTAGQQLLDELASLRAWRDQAVEVMEELNRRNDYCSSCDCAICDGEPHEPDCKIAACLAAAKETT